MMRIAVILIVCLLTGVSHAGSQQSLQGTQIQYGEMAQDLLNKGKPDKAVALLAQGVQKHPESDWLRSLYGRALFSIGKLDEAEDQFQQALEINTDNPVARTLIKEIRLTKDALKDREMNKLVELGVDKAGDLAVIVFGVWLGTLMTMISGRLANHFSRGHFEKALRRKDWDVVTDILENLIANWKKRELRKDMEMMLKEMPQEEIEKIIINYVDVQKHEDDLLFFLRKLRVKRG